MESENQNCSNDNEPLVINTDHSDDKTYSFRPSLPLVLVNITILGYFVPAYIYFVSIQEDVNNRISHSYNISEQNRENCLSGNITNETTTYRHIEATTSYWMMLTNGAGLLPAFFVTLFIGPCSDKIGRRVALLIPAVGAFLKYILNFLISYFQWPIWCYTISTFVEGSLGASSLFYAACVAYVADNTDKKQRFFWICVVDLCLSLSAVIANFCSGYIINGLGFTWAYVILGTAQFITILFMALAIKENPVDYRNIEIFTTKHFRRVIDLFCKDNGTNRRWKLTMLLTISLLMILGNVRLSDVLTIMMLNRPLCFSPIMLGNFFSVLHVVMTVGGFLLVLLRRYEVKEVPLLYIAIASFIGFEVTLSFAQAEKTYFLATLFSIGLVLGTPLVNSLMSPLVQADEQGALFSAVSWLLSLGLFMNTVYQDAVYSATVSICRGLICIVTAGVEFLAGILLTILVLVWRRENKRFLSTEINKVVNINDDDQIHYE